MHIYDGFEVHGTASTPVILSLRLSCADDSDWPFSATVQYGNCGRGSQTSALASEPRAHEGAHRAQVTYPSLSGQV